MLRESAINDDGSVLIRELLLGGASLAGVNRVAA